MKIPKGNRIVPYDPNVCDETLRGRRNSGYRGCQSKTRSGRICQAWNSQYPHKHNRGGNWFYGTSGPHNNCRNPDGEKTIWCYTTDPSSRWEYCNPLPRKANPLALVVLVVLCFCCCAVGILIKKVFFKQQVEVETPGDAAVTEHKTEMEKTESSLVPMH